MKKKLWVAYGFFVSSHAGTADRAADEVALRKRQRVVVRIEDVGAEQIEPDPW